MHYQEKGFFLLNMGLIYLFYFIYKYLIWNFPQMNNYLEFPSWQPLADAEGAKKNSMIELLKSYGGLSYVSIWSSLSLFSWTLIDGIANSAF